MLPVLICYLSIFALIYNKQNNSLLHIIPILSHNRLPQNDRSADSYNPPFLTHFHHPDDWASFQHVLLCGWRMMTNLKVALMSLPAPQSHRQTGTCETQCLAAAIGERTGWWPRPRYIRWFVAESCLHYCGMSWWTRSCWSDSECGSCLG